MTPQNVKDLAVQSQLVSPWLGFVVPRDTPEKPAAARPADPLLKAA